MKPETKIADLTVGQFSELVRQLIGTAAPQKYVYGLQGLADLFGVSLSSAKRIKSSGILRRAIHQQGRTTVVDADLAMRLWFQDRRTNS